MIRPLALCDESDLAAYAEAIGFPIIPCNLCGTQENMHRQKMKALLNELHAENPAVRGSMTAALGNIEVSQMLDLSLRERVGLPTI